MYASIPKGKTVYLYCHDSFRMGLAWLQLRHLCHQDVRLYNGDWSHWDKQLTLPIVEGDQPFDETFAP
jgi:thiosulfate/3-mercaptopyruvate sulfurtransferase